MDMSWTDEAVADMLNAWNEKDKSMADIATFLSQKYGYVTRSAVAGKLRRLGAPMRKPCVAVTPKQARQPAPRPAPKRILRVVPCGPNGGHQAVAVTYKPIPDVLSADDIPMDQRKSLFELETWHCRFPYGQPGETGFFFCGAPEADLNEKRPYCPFHTRHTHIYVRASNISWIWR